METKDLFKRACKIHTQFLIARYLMSNAEGRLDGVEKAQRHIELCEFYVAVAFGWPDPDTVQGNVDGAIELFQEIHSKTQEKLTDNMDRAICFPTKGYPNYDELEPRFFNVFHDITMGVIGEIKKGEDNK